MKKLMIAVAVVLAGVAANAASVMWASSDTISTPQGESYEGGLVNMYVYEITDVTVWDKYNAMTTEAMSKAVVADFGTTSELWDNDMFGSISINGAKTDYTPGSTAYAAIVFEYGDGDEVPYQYKGNIASYTWGETESGDGAVANLDFNRGGTGGDASDTIAWAVPEPTSGLLLLLGVAGLALRRRRA